MRARTVACILAIAASSLVAGCLDVSGCWGEATWTEPGLWDWLEQNGTANGFRRADGPPLPLAAGQDQVPAGATLQDAHYSIGSRVHRDVTLWNGSQILVAAWEFPGTVVPPPVADMLEAFDQAMVAYAGPPEELAAARQQLEREWPPPVSDGGVAQVTLTLAGPWDFGEILRREGFVEEGDGAYRLDEGAWTLGAREPRWEHYWPDEPKASSLTVDPDDRATFEVQTWDDDGQVKGFVLQDQPGFDWTFQEFGYDTNCVPGPVF